MRVLVTGGSGFIGTRVVDDLVAQGHQIRNLDVKPPLKPSHKPYWRAVNLVNGPGVRHELESYCPQVVIHMAARTDTLGRSLSDYRENIVGTDSLIDAIRAKADSIDRVIFFSTQFVNQDPEGPRHDLDFAPYTAYGQSKVINEQAIRAADLPCSWALVRPTNIWGPWHPRYPKEFWRVLRRGLYMHPGGMRVIRSYGYVGNVSAQVLSLLSAERSLIDRQVFYLGDAPLDLFEWANGFSQRLLGRGVVIVPRPIVRGAALVGDVVTACGVRFPITSSRFTSMTTDNPAPMDKTLALPGATKYTLAAGIDETVAWLVSQEPEFWSPPAPRRGPERPAAEAPPPPDHSAELGL